MDLWIGTSGYSYPDWVGGFYPAGTRPDRMLAYYSRRFPLVELNFTFYRPPTPEMLAKLAAQTPDGFQFLVKLPQSISHERSPATSTASAGPCWRCAASAGCPVCSASCRSPPTTTGRRGPGSKPSAAPSAT